MPPEGSTPNFCSDCGMSLVSLDTWCTSRKCADCGKEIFFARRGENGGVKIEKGDKLHIPQLTLSLDPKSGGQFSRYGLEGFIKQMFSGYKPISEENLIEHYKDIEKNLDLELSGLDCIKHCNLETQEGAEEAHNILISEELNQYEFNLFRSSNLRVCYTAIAEGDALKAAYSAHMGNIFKEFSLLENHHLKEIIWLGYLCYVDLSKNEELTEKAAREKQLINSAIAKIRTYETDMLSVFIKDGKDISPRISISGVDESTLSALIEHEVEERNRDKEESLKREELKLKKIDSQIKLWGFLFTLANGLILAFYKNWLG